MRVPDPRYQANETLTLLSQVRAPAELLGQWPGTPLRAPPRPSSAAPAALGWPPAASRTDRSSISQPVQQRHSLTATMSTFVTVPTLKGSATNSGSKRRLYSISEE